MPTIDSIIAEARYDLRDTNSSLYTDAELLAYANRALVQLDNVLSVLHSDWVYNEYETTLSTSNNYIDAPDNCILLRSAWIGTSELKKVTPERLYELRKYVSSSYQPQYFALKGTQILFECVPDDTYTIKVYYDKRHDPLSLGDNMPYNDEFNGAIREVIIMLADKRNENEPASDAEIYNWFADKLFANALRRKFTYKRRRLDF